MKKAFRIKPIRRRGDEASRENPIDEEKREAVDGNSDKLSRDNRNNTRNDVKNQYRNKHQVSSTTGVDPGNPEITVQNEKKANESSQSVIAVNETMIVNIAMFC
ncbi:hypothetical protein K7432_012172 [Basidiobolus ranarum]|uniref:Uncharacterized protein n=1 Tax=Basidiobolus ranarum TaxID=34480 RepID=A0ABR2VSP7_9FUNG